MHLFSGTGVALITPFDTNGQVDFEALDRVVEHVITGQVEYLVALGTTGETPTLTHAEKLALLRAIVRKTAGRVPVVCGAGGNHTTGVIDWIQEVQQEGIAGLLSVVPYYNKPSQEGIYQHFAAIAASTELPIILYNVPGRTVTNMLPATTLRLAQDFNHIVAIKEASGSLPQCMELVASAPDGFAVLSGDDDLVLAQLACGMHGVISVAANCYPKDFSDLVRAGLANGFPAARTLHYKLLPAVKLLFAEGNPTGAKAVLHQMGLCQNVLRLPLIAASESLYGQLQNAI
ncbi:MAG: 4-hydroxy-tetrahydrodipicolinate synthase [Sphingobacteriales bacterium]|nr:MAG: 4-hydroxy-tetrahydrodipicolinate synthase [Sphingobacteriales bacterium]